MNDKNTDEFWMHCALTLAEHAEAKGEVPVGAVLVLNEKKIGEGSNSSISYHDPTAHAEIIALRQGAKTIGNYRISGAIMYVTLEPCVMCAGAMSHARISKIVFGARETRKNKTSVAGRTVLNNSIILCPGVLAEACSLQLSAFFHRKRTTHKIKNK